MIVLTDVYKAYSAELAATPPAGESAPYDWGNLPSQLDLTWFPYSLMFGEFSRELSNTINQLTDYVHRLKAWSVVIRPLRDEELLSVVSEFVEPLATLALNLPYVIKARFIFASAHLAHQANRLKDGSDWKDDLPLDTNIDFNIASTYGRRWRRFNRLKLCIEAIAAQNYRGVSGDFRNRYNHRISPRIAIGVTGVVTRAVDPATGNISYRIGEPPPIALDTVVRILGEQGNLCHKGLEAFQAFVAEHEAAIRADLVGKGV